MLSKTEVEQIEDRLLAAEQCAPLLAAMLAADDLAASVAFYLGPYGGDRDALAAQLRRFRETVRVQTALMRGGQIHA